MKRIISRYKKCINNPEDPTGEKHKPENQQAKEADDLKEEIEKLKLKQLRLLGKDFTGMGLQELRVLEQQLNEGLLCINERKEQVLMQQLAQSRTQSPHWHPFQEQRAMLENELLRRQVEELRGFFPSTSSPTPLCLKYHSALEKSKPAIMEGSRSPETTCNGGLADENDSDTTLQLGLRLLPSGNGRKRKTSECETHSSTSDTQFRLQ